MQGRNDDTDRTKAERRDEQKKLMALALMERERCDTLWNDTDCRAGLEADFRVLAEAIQSHWHNNDSGQALTRYGFIKWLRKRNDLYRTKQEIGRLELGYNEVCFFSIQATSNADIMCKLQSDWQSMLESLREHGQLTRYLATAKRIDPSDTNAQTEAKAINTDYVAQRLSVADALARIEALAAPTTASMAATVSSGIRQSVGEIDLRRFPLPIQSLVNALADINDIVPSILHLGAAYAMVGHLIGKRMVCDNKGTIYYPNLWAVCLAPTASGKTGAVTPIERSLMRSGTLMPSATMAGAFDCLGASITKMNWQKLTDIQREQEQSELFRRADCDLRGRILLSDECTRAIDSLIGGWDSKRPSRDIGDLLKLADSGALIQRQLSGEGYKVIADCCLSFLGYSQNETWQRKFGGDEFKSQGLFGRFLPITATYLRLIGLGAAVGGLSDAIASINDRATTMTTRTICTFGERVAKGETDHIGRVMLDIEATEEGQTFKRVYRSDWENLRGKIIGHAIKMSMIDAFLDGRVIDGRAVDCSSYFKKNATLATFFYLAYLQQLTTVSHAGAKEDKVKSLLAKHGSMSRRDLTRTLNFYNASEFEMLMRGMASDGEIVIDERVNRNGTKTTVYRLA